ncbi:MAG: hypothetical protein KGP14_03295 [Betaproteobacteria bacterium]|nr:hypothetical protein [Betaproteobacteria bacterium]
MRKTEPWRAYAQPDYSSQSAKTGVAAIKRLYGQPDDVGRQALDWIIRELARVEDMTFRPDDKGGERETAFAEGRRFVGNELARIIRTAYDKLTA